MMFGLFSKRISSNHHQSRSMRVVRSRYDSAQTTCDNRRHWAAADGLAPDASVSPGVRRVLRNRARYEVANNSYAKGIVLTLANDTIGTGPRLQMMTDDADMNRAIEREFDMWSEAVNLAGKLHTMRAARAESGEAFGILTTNDNLDSPVKLDIRLIEPDHVASPFPVFPKRNEADGIVFDKFGNPTSYHVLKHHPGGASSMLGFKFKDEFDTIDAKLMIHYFRADRPGQHRGVPDITPSLPLFAQLRRFTLATIAAAETAADYAAVIYSETMPDAIDDAVEGSDFETIELEKRMATVLPAGYKLGQIRAEHPSTTYAEFKSEILNEIARCLNMPFNVAAGNSSAYNYASGRLDHQTYFKSIRVEQRNLRVMVLDRVFRAWFNEAILLSGFLPQSARVRDADISHQWFWDGTEHVDPAKEANAQETRLLNNTTTLANEFAKQGLDWEDQLRQRSKEIQMMRELGIDTARMSSTENGGGNG